MAAVGDSAYLPPLDRLLNGDSQLLSWEKAFSGLSQLPPGPGEKSLSAFFQDDRTLALLTQFLSPFSSPTAQTRAVFDTQTSAIHVTPTSSGRYDISEIKEDCLWLSKEVGIDEVSALRIVILEWQARPAAWLLRGITDKDGPGNDLKGGQKSLRSSLLASKYGLSTDVAVLGIEATERFDTSQERRLRILNMYISERQYLPMTAAFITFEALNGKEPKLYNNAQETSQSQRLSWRTEVGSKIVARWKLSSVASTSGYYWIVDAIAALEARFQNLNRGSGWLKDEDTAIQLEIGWCRIQLTEIIQILRTILALVISQKNLTRSDVFRSWFELMSNCSFLEQFDLPYQELNESYTFPIQSLIALTSLAVLKVPVALLSLHEISSRTIMGSSADDAPYILNKAVIDQANEVLTNAASAVSYNASLAIFAWGIIMQNVRDYAEASKESWDLRQSQRAMESFGASQQSDSDSNEHSFGQRRPSPHRPSSTGSDGSQQITHLEDLLDIVKPTPNNEDQITFLAKTSVDVLRVFDVITSLATTFCTPFGSEHYGEPGLGMRLLLLELLRAALDWLDYGPDVIQAILAVLQGSDQYWDLLERPPIVDAVAPVTVFLQDTFLMQRIFEVALSRYPHESLPFLKICAALATCRSPLDQVDTIPFRSTLSNMTTFTCLLPEDAATYTLGGDADSIYVELTSNLDMFHDHPILNRQNAMMLSSRELVRHGQSNCSGSFQIPEGTTGRTLTENKPHIVLWRHEYSAFQYMGKLLQRTMLGGALRDRLGLESTREIVTEIVGFLTAIVASMYYGQLHDWETESAQDIVRSMLEETSDALEGNDDIVSLVFSIFEAELHQSRSVSEEEGANQLILHCIQFTHALLFVLPGRVWPFLGRSGLLGLDGKESRMAAVVTATEVACGSYDFLIGCVRVFGALLDDAMTHIVSRREYHHVSARYRHSEPEAIGTGITEVLMQKILAGFERLMIDVLESFRNWRFLFPYQRLEISARICLIFDRILSSCFAVDDSLEVSHKLTSFLAPAAEYLLDVYLSKGDSDAPIQPLFHNMVESLASKSCKPTIQGAHYRILQTKASLQFATTLVRVNLYLGRRSPRLEDQLFKAIPLLTMIYAAHDEYKTPVAELLEALVRHAGSSDGKNLSLLGHMGQGTAKHFLDMLSVLDMPFDDTQLSIRIWRLLSAVVSQRQQWFAIYLLTGSTPRENLKNKHCPSTIAHHVRPMLQVAIDRFCNFDTLLPEEAVSTLEFIAQATDFWPWVVGEIVKNPHLITIFTKFLHNFGSSAQVSSVQSAEGHPNQLQMASLIVDICAMALHHSNETRDSTFAGLLLPNLSYLMQHGVAVPSYNISLHSNLRKNFEAKFPTCSLLNFKRTKLERPFLGTDYYYDMGLAKTVLKYDSTWEGKGDGGFAEELARANVNLSVVEAQGNLLRSWKTLVMQLSISLGGDKNFQASLVSVIRNCLKFNLDNTLPEAIFSRLSESRADLAFALMQRTMETIPRSIEAQSVLRPAWNTLRTWSPDIGLGLTNTEAAYCRTLLKILYLALQAHTPDIAAPYSEPARAMDGPSAMENSQAALEILAVVVAQGFRSLTTLLHEDTTKILPTDFALIIAILRSALRVPGVDRHPEQLVAKFTDDSTARYACTLLSWSDKLAVDDDPIYGELSLAFLTELSTVPVLAESIAVEGLLTQISSANLMQYFRRAGGSGPFSEPTTMYTMWYKSILPFALNLLEAIGAPVAAEVSTFIDQFRGQLSRASNSFDTKPRPSPSDPSAGYVTLGMASEAHSLVLIVAILDTFRNAGSSAGIVAGDVVWLAWDKNQVKEDLDSWLQRRKTLRDCILATNEREEAWSRQKAVNRQSGAENRLEEKVLDEMSAAMSILSDVGEF
ncbi:hypothetical protein MMC13_001291 [Lambiella insularis]|nr:hypothetical protein [Lambiella insularis]